MGNDTTVPGNMPHVWKHWKMLVLHVHLSFWWKLSNWSVHKIKHGVGLNLGHVLFMVYID
jgi:hypothetical protein